VPFDDKQLAWWQISYRNSPKKPSRAFHLYPQGLLFQDRVSDKEAETNANWWGMCVAKLQLEQFDHVLQNVLWDKTDRIVTFCAPTSYSPVLPGTVDKAYFAGSDAFSQALTTSLGHDPKSRAQIEQLLETYLTSEWGIKMTRVANVTGNELVVIAGRKFDCFVGCYIVTSAKIDKTQEIVNLVDDFDEHYDYIYYNKVQFGTTKLEEQNEELNEEPGSRPLSSLDSKQNPDAPMPIGDISDNDNTVGEHEQQQQQQNSYVSRCIIV